MNLKPFLVRVYTILACQIGIDPRFFIRTLRALPSYARDWRAFRKQYSGEMVFMPSLQDQYEESGATKNEYFWQDLLVARLIHKANPEKHVDIGSRVDGFVAHIASFRNCEVFDVRPTTSVVPGITFHQADLMKLETLVGYKGGYCDSLSCLHAIEHFGLGRYGDPINAQGYLLGITHMSQLLRLGGLFYLATPIGRERVEFNANWVFDPRTIISAAETSGLSLKNLIIITPDHGYQEIDISPVSLRDLSLSNYKLGLFIFEKSI
jgi:hypothetical protein